MAAVGPTNTLHHGAVLCFTQRPHLHIEGARAILLAGDKRDDGLVGETIEGPLSTQVERLVKLTISKLSSHWKFDKDGMRIDTLEIEPKVIREAISNAIAHRSYESAGTTKVEISNSFIDISNPGEFSADTPWESLLNATSKTSSPKNAAVSLYLNRLLAMEGVGRNPIHRT